MILPVGCYAGFVGLSWFGLVVRRDGVGLVVRRHGVGLVVRRDGFGLVVRRDGVGLVVRRHGVEFSLLNVHGCGLWTLSCDFCPSLPTETLKWLSSLPILMQESFWW